MPIADRQSDSTLCDEIRDHESRQTGKTKERSSKAGSSPAKISSTGPTGSIPNIGIKLRNQSP